MRLQTVLLSNVPPVGRFEVTDLADVVVLAGPNGVGKTRLADAILNAFRAPGGFPNVRVVVQATSESERRDWGRGEIDTAVPEEARLLQLTIQRNRRRTHWESSIFQFESERTNPVYNGYGFSFDAPDPWEEMIGWDLGMGGLRSRYSDSIQSIFRKVHSRRDAIARRGLELINSGRGTFDPADFPDPIEPFKRAFRQLLAPKELEDPEPREQALFYRFQGQRFMLSSLSSGEKEVVNIAFDFLLRDPTDSIIVFDEPELHLHPELSYKLLHTLRNAGPRNQFIFVTHSPDIITASLEHTVIFVSPPKENSANQAIVVREDDATNEALKLIGQSIGIVSLGKRIVLIEGAHTSLDKQTYGAILKDRFPTLVLVPSGGRGLIQSFSKVVDSVLSHALWGVDFYMLCDRDALPVGAHAGTYENATGQRLRILKRYHLENYFLEESVLSRVFRDLEREGSWLRDPAAIRAKLDTIAMATVPYATALTVSAQIREAFGNIDVMVKGCHGKSAGELAALVASKAISEAERFESAVSVEAVVDLVRGTYGELESAVRDGTWKARLPGKAIFEQFASSTGLQSSRLKLRYLAEAEIAEAHPFQDVIEICERFAA